MGSKVNTAMAIMVMIVVVLALIGAIIKGEAVQIIATILIAFLMAMLCREVRLNH